MIVRLQPRTLKRKSKSCFHSLTRTETHAGASKPAGARSQKPGVRRTPRVWTRRVDCPFKPFHAQAVHPCSSSSSLHRRVSSTRSPRSSIQVHTPTPPLSHACQQGIKLGNQYDAHARQQGLVLRNISSLKWLHLSQGPRSYSHGTETGRHWQRHFIVCVCVCVE